LYFFNFTVEFIVILLYIALRIDLLFHTPDGSKGPYSYSRRADAAEQEVENKSLERQSTDRVKHGTEAPHTPIGVPAMEKAMV